MVKVLVKDLDGVALDWAVAKCEGKLGEITQAKTWASLSRERGGIAFTHGRVFTPSTSWAQGGLIIEREDILFAGVRGAYYAWLANRTKLNFDCPAPTHLTAAMRCYVTKQYGPEIEIPDELAANQALSVATAFRVRLENGDFWAEDEEVMEFKSPAEVLQAVDEFLAGAKEGGLDYSQEDIEVVAPDGTVLNIAQVKKLLAPGNTQAQAEMSDMGERRDAIQQARRLVKHLEMYAELMDEAASLIERIPAEVFDSIEGRYPLCDELGGAAGMAREDAAAAKSDPRVVVSVSGGCVTNVYSDIVGVGSVLHDDDHLRELGRTPQERKTLLAAATAGCVDVEVTDSMDHLERVLVTQDAPVKADGHEQQKKSESSGPSGP